MQNSDSVCEKCGMVIPHGTLCQTCRKYKRNGGVWHPLPAHGHVEYDDEGRVICHVCGMALTKLIEHTKRKHGLTSEEYRKEFGLMKGACLIAPAYANKMVAHAKRCRTFDRNFLPVQQGSARGKRGHGYKWSTQEVEVRRPAQAYNSRQRWEPKKQQGV